jgi:pyrimidine-specific ribonucleoside hydrolase
MAHTKKTGLFFASIILISSFILAQNQPINVWIDTDPAAGIKNRDVDDGLALLQAFYSPEIKIEGISVVFGNTPLKQAFPIAKEMVSFASYPIPVYAGASTQQDLGKPTSASKALAKKLAAGPITILAFGPITNIATVVKNHPELHGNIREIIAVAGRRPGQRFQTGEKNKKAHRDLNFELDAKGFQILLDSNIPLVLTPFEISSQVWITKEDLKILEQGGSGARWIASPALDWLSLWNEVFAVEGFNPFDTLAVAYLTSPEWMKKEVLPAQIQILPDDGTEKRMQGTNTKEKPYLLVDKSLLSKKTVTYCYLINKELFKKDLLKRIHDGSPKNTHRIKKTSQK